MQKCYLIEFVVFIQIEGEREWIKKINLVYADNFAKACDYLKQQYQVNTHGLYRDITNITNLTIDIS